MSGRNLRTIGIALLAGVSFILFFYSVVVLPALIFAPRAP